MVEKRGDCNFPGSVKTQLIGITQVAALLYSYRVLRGNQKYHGRKGGETRKFWLETDCASASNGTVMVASLMKMGDTYQDR